MCAATNPVAEPPQWLIDMIAVRPKPVQSIPARHNAFWNGIGASPAERFNTSTSWAEILMPHG